MVMRMPRPLPVIVCLALGCTAETRSADKDVSTSGTASVDGTQSGDAMQDTGEGGASEDSVDWCQDLTAVGWSEETHAKGVDGDYAHVFGQDFLPRIDIVICPSDYAAMRADIELLVEPAGGGGGRPEDDIGLEADPMYVPVTVGFEGQTWPYVGMRYKGNSSLVRAVQRGVEKLPFRLHFDRYEEDVPEVDNQRFHGFKELKFSSGFEDESLIRDKLTSDLFREAGVPSAAGGMMSVFVDVGEGPVFWGVYAGFEDPSGELLDSWFGSDDGNLYKPDGDTATLADFDAEDFEKKTNEEEADWSDVELLVSVLNADRDDAEAWRGELEAVFDVDGYLRYLAMNNLIGNWDSYGNMTHNYYLYANPENGDRLSWIPWDFNEALRTEGKRPLIPISLESVDPRWPLIAHLAGDSVYDARYRSHLEELLDEVFIEENVRSRAEGLHARVAAAVADEALPYTNLSRYSEFEGALDASDGIVTRVGVARAEASAHLGW